jgi:signal peptidase II
MQTRGGAVLAHERRRTRVRAIALAAAVIVLDHATKFALVRTLALGESRPLLDGVVWLSHFRNPGAAFGLLRGFGGVLALAAIVGVVIFAAMLVRQPDPMTATAAALVAGGAAGNLIDRLVRPGGVVDFVDLRFWPAFNVADSAISIGAVLFLWASLRTRQREQEKTADAQDPGS